MLLDERHLQETESRLDFEPAQVRASLEQAPPLQNEEPERQQKRVAQVVAAAGGESARLDLERIINGNDLLNINYLDKGLLAAAAVGRVVVIGSDGEPLGFGTGSLISPRLMLTNNHVLRDAAVARNSQFQFNYQFDTRGRLLPTEDFEMRPEEFFYTNEKLDFTVVAVAETSLSGRAHLSQYGALRLNREIGKVSPGESLTIIQHPGGNPKQIAVRENQLLKIEEFFLWYMTDTAPGSSGSPVFNDQWQIVALHHSGIPAKDEAGNWLTVDGKVWDPTSMDESRVKWIANEGVRVSCIVQDVEANCSQTPLARDFLDSIRRAPGESVAAAAASTVPAALLTSITSPPTSHATNGGGAAADPNGKDRQMSDVTTNANQPPAGLDTSVETPAPAQTTVRAAPGGSVSIDVPLTVTISLGGGTTTNGHAAGNGGTVAGGGTDMMRIVLDEAVSIDPNYASRKGYDENFLGTGPRAVKLPRLDGAAQMKAAINKKAAPGADKHVLPYHHYSVVMNRERRMAFYTAVNIDGRLSRRIKREKDKWFRDPRIDAAEQNGEELYAGNDLDRGHLVRRLDPAWGTSEPLAKVANDDTFHFTNCTPQHKDFNQNQQTWAGLEDYVLDHADAEDFKVSVFTGPVFSNGDPDYRGYKLPRQFWKVVVMVRPGGKLSATAYLLSQASLIKNLDEAFVFGAYKTYQVAVKKIEGLTGLNFGNLRTFDPKNNQEADTAAELAHPSQIVF
jgi:endonuclease G